ncbi:MAG: hypothetical protein KOO66_06645 [Bacteroidales bacterium]|nr:hypothetical protein [Bacteroidales bacterium]
MKYIKIIPAILLITVNFFAVAQNNNSDNIIDERGFKQGFWEKHYDNGNIQYQGYFKDNKPVGEFKRFTKKGVLKVILNYHENSNKIYAKFYHPGKIIQAEGFYLGQNKDSIWSYYSVDGYLINQVSYIDNIKTGTEKQFYQNGNIHEKSEWKDGVKDGLVMRFYDSGKVMMRIFYMNGRLEGEYNVYGPDENILIQGQYENNKREGKWIYYKDNGHIKDELNYTNGVADNQEELERLENEYIEMMEKNKGKFKEPTEDMYNAIPPGK